MTLILKIDRALYKVDDAQKTYNGTVFKKDIPIKWKCRNCGYVHEGNEAPGVCPVCNHPRSYFELWTENY